MRASMVLTAALVCAIFIHHSVGGDGSAALHCAADGNPECSFEEANTILGGHHMSTDGVDRREFRAAVVDENTDAETADAILAVSDIDGDGLLSQSEFAVAGTLQRLVALITNGFTQLKLPAYSARLMMAGFAWRYMSDLRPDSLIYLYLTSVLSGPSQMH